VAHTPIPDELERPWLASYPPGVPPSYHVPDVPVQRLLVDAARDFPTRVALQCERLELDHDAVAARVTELAGALQLAGTVPGARVLVALPSGVSAPLVLLAVWRLGAVAVVVAHDGDPTHALELATLVDASAVVGDRTAIRTLEEAAHAGAPALPSTCIVVEDDTWVGDGAGLGLTGRLRSAQKRLGSSFPRRSRHVVEGAQELEELLGQVDPEVALPPLPAASAPALVASTPGAPPSRAVVLTHANLVASAFHLRLWVPDIQAGRERLLLVDALHEVPTLIGWLVGLLAGAAVCIVPDRDADVVARRVERLAPTLAVLTPAVLGGLVRESEAARRDLTALRVVLAVGAPVPPQIAADLERRSGGARVRELTGWPETAGLTHGQPVYGRVVARALGVPVTGTVAVVVDPDHLDVVRAPGEIGRLLVHGQQVAAGYVDDAAATAERFRDGWFVTDLLVTVDEGGTFRALGRDADVVVRDGHHIAPRTVEEAVERHPGVRRAAAIADPRTGELVVVVTIRRRRGPTPDELAAHCREQLADDDVPDTILVVDVLPMTAVGEVDRAALRDQLAGQEAS
jgi:long-chain acyl-CoA synthetase